MMYEYESENGFKGILQSGFQYDLTIYEKEPGEFKVQGWKIVFHAIYGRMISEQEFKNQVDNFPETRDLLLGINRN